MQNSISEYAKSQESITLQVSKIAEANIFNQTITIAATVVSVTMAVVVIFIAVLIYLKKNR